MFRSREHAAERLAVRLITYRGHRPLVLAVPRGGVPMGRIIADALEGELDVVLVHKIGAPGHAEYAIGAVDENGHAEFSAIAHDVRPDYLHTEVQRLVLQLQARRQRYGRLPADPSGRTVIVVDDGVATGATLLAALRLLTAQHPARLVAAVAVAPKETLAALGRVADEVVCLETPDWFRSVGEHFEDFRQVSDDEVEALLAAQPTTTQ